MKTRVFTFILLVLMMICYSSCSSDDPLNDEIEQGDKTFRERLAIEEKIAESINGNTYRCEELNSEFRVTSAGKPHKTALYVTAGFVFTGDIVKRGIGDLISGDGSSTSSGFDIKYDNHIAGKQVTFKYINKDILEGISQHNKGIWKRIK